MAQFVDLHVQLTEIFQSPSNGWNKTRALKFWMKARVKCFGSSSEMYDHLRIEWTNSEPWWGYDEGIRGRQCFFFFFSPRHQHFSIQLHGLTKAVDRQVKLKEEWLWCFLTTVDVLQNLKECVCTPDGELLSTERIPLFYLLTRCVASSAKLFLATRITPQSIHGDHWRFLWHVS